MRYVLPSALFTAALATPAYAYLDPGTGSIVVQAIIGGIAVASTTVSVFWSRIKTALLSKRTPPTDQKR
jgi:hypothetical protein